ncbi:MAG TPA: AI-2E family transporter [Gammaproteobacteria bacterium]|nr:AI-2E family transporter [Gammaproteobacteria bacterium]
MSTVHRFAPGRGLAARTALVVGIALLATLLTAFFWFVSHGLLVMFSAAVLAVVLEGLSGWVRRYSKLPRALALTVTIATIAVGLAAVLWIGGMRISNQGPALRANLEQSVHHLESRLKKMGVNPSALGAPSGSGGLIHGALTHLLASRASISETVNFAADVLIIVVAGIYFAAQPTVYLETVVKLFPLERRDRLREVFRAVANALRRWVAGRLAAMLAVGIITTVGMLLLNVRLALLLGLMAGGLTFIPYLGSIVSLIPAVLIALLNGPATALYVALLYLGAHITEGYVLTPIIQEEVVHLAPGWLIMAQLFGYLLAGVFGMAMATPVAVVVTIVVQMLYIQDVLGDHVRLLGN